jgi:uncharacterized membrane protein
MRGRLLLLLAALAVASCDFEHQKGSMAPSDDGADASESDAPGWDVVNRAVIQPSCVTCHATQQPTFNSYSEAFNARELIRQAALGPSPIMPLSPAPGLSANQKTLLQRWLDLGAPETAPPAGAAPSPSPSPSGGDVTWSVLKEKVLTPSCLGCHFPQNQNNLSDLSTYDLFKSVAPTAFALTVELQGTGDQMPPAPLSLTRDQLQLFANWFVDGQRN